MKFDHHKWIYPLIVANGTFKAVGTRKGLLTDNGGYMSAYTVRISKGDGGYDVPTRRDSFVRMRVGMDNGQTPDRDLGGHVPDIQLYDFEGKDWSRKHQWLWNFVGPGRPLDCPLYLKGEFASMGYVEASHKPPPYLRLYHGARDHICISAIGTHHPGAQEELIFGDMMAYCGWDWYESVEAHTMGGSHPDDPMFVYFPKCFWMGHKGDGGIYASHMWFHMPDFMGIDAEKAFNANDKQICHSWPRLMRSYVPEKKFRPLIYNPPLEDVEQCESDNVDEHGQKSCRYEASRTLDHCDWAWRQGPTLWDVKRGSEDDPRKHPTGIPGALMMIRAVDALTRVLPAFAQRLVKRKVRGWSGYCSYGEDWNNWSDSRVAKRAEEERKGLKFEAWATEYSLTWREGERYSAITKCQEVATGFTGPDWANGRERLYCQLKTQRVFPFCEAEDQEECWDEKNEVLRVEPSTTVLHKRWFGWGETVSKKIPGEQIQKTYKHYF